MPKPAGGSAEVAAAVEVAALAAPSRAERLTLLLQLPPPPRLPALQPHVPSVPTRIRWLMQPA